MYYVGRKEHDEDGVASFTFWVNEKNDELALFMKGGQ